MYNNIGSFMSRRYGSAPPDSVWSSNAMWNSNDYNTKPQSFNILNREGELTARDYANMLAEQFNPTHARSMFNVHTAPHITELYSWTFVMIILIIGVMFLDMYKRVYHIETLLSFRNRGD